jgi:hypothetical protein
MPASPSLLIVPARFKTGKLYTQIATTSAGLVLGSSGDFNVTRATTATRFNSAGLIESVASGVPRLDYFTSGGTAGCPALLVEPSAANGILNSQDTTTSWTLGANLSGSYVDVIGVSGNNLTVAASGSSIGSSAGRLVRFNNNVALASGSTYTISFLMRQTGAHTIGGYYAVITGGASGNLGSGFDVSGSFSSGSLFAYTGVTSRIRRVERFGSGVFRCSETFTMTASGTLTEMSFGPTLSTTANTNPAVGLGIAFAAPQIELGLIPTSFIPTAGAAVTRNTDVVSLSGAVSGCVGQTEGVIYIECQADVTNNDVILINTAGQTPGNNYIGIFKVSTNLYRGRVVASGSTIDITQSVATSGFIKAALAYKTGDTAFFVNGVQVGTTNTTAFTFNGALNAIQFIANLVVAARPTNIRSAALYSTRLTDSELAALTTL